MLKNYDWQIALLSSIHVIKAKDEKAVAFYQKFGFLSFDSVPQLLWAGREELKMFI